MRIAILGGGGAMGGLFGAYLSRGGADVTLIDVSRKAIDAINANGLIVEQKDGTTEAFRLPATDAPAEVGEVDLIINFVKCYHTAGAIRAAVPMIGKDTAVMTLQNGWGNAQAIGAIVGDDRVVVGLTYNSGSLIAPGHVKHTAISKTLIGEQSGRTTDRLDAIEAAFRSGGLETIPTDRIVEEVWKKLALNCCALPVSGLLGLFADELIALPGAERVVAAILREVVDVAAAKGLSLDYDAQWATIRGILANAKGAKASMLQDVEARRQTEIEVINGAISAGGRETGVPTPVNDTLVALIEAMQMKYLSAAN